MKLQTGKWGSKVKLRCGILEPLMTAMGQKPNPSGTVACQLSPAPPDIPAHARSAALCQQPTYAVQQRAPLFDYLVGALLKMQRHVKAECLGGLEVDHQLELDWSLDGEFVRLRASEDAIDIGRRAAEIIRDVAPVGQQAAKLPEELIRIDGGESVASSKGCDLRAMASRALSVITIMPLFRLASLRGNHGFELGLVLNGCSDCLYC